MAGEAYQSSLLTRYVKQPSMPASSSIHNALGYERTNGWPGLGPVRHQPAAVNHRNSAAASGIPRPSQNGTGKTTAKSKTGSRIPPSGKTSKANYAF